MLDIWSGYNNITMIENSKKYIAFTTEYGKYEFPCVPFSIHIALVYSPMILKWNLQRK